MKNNNIKGIVVALKANYLIVEINAHFVSTNCPDEKVNNQILILSPLNCQYDKACPYHPTIAQL